MLFSSSVFLIGLLAAALVTYYTLLRTRRQRNVFLMLASLVFYAWGEVWFVFVMLGSIAMNWLFGLAIDRRRGDMKLARRLLIVDVAMNLGLLFVYKYSYFVLSNANALLSLNLPAVEFALPLGISFFTFQAMSYVIDVYRGDGEAQRRFTNVCLYVSFFPQLIAGPIVRYQTIQGEIEHRRENWNDFNEGIRRLAIGLCKKVLLADVLGALSLSLFQTEIAELSVANAWLGDVAYALQVYYDFSGYSDMAIGLGLMFGFHFLENFTFPYIAKSISEFWRRWHISMSTWFRDYVFFPMGGSRVSRGRWLFNMIVLWLLIGLWHGAKWNYIVWGLCFCALLVFERLTGLERRWRRWVWLRYAYTLFFVLLTSVIVYAGIVYDGNIGYAFRYIGRMFGAGGAALVDEGAIANARAYGYFLIGGIVFAMPVGAWLKERLRIGDAWSRLFGNGLLFAGFLLALSYSVQGAFSPFLYFNF